MTDVPGRGWSWRGIPLATWIGGVLAVGGLVLTAEVHFGFLMLTALGAFGPGLLRELGWLHDQDEFQRRAAHRAGYHAFLVTGFATFGFYAYTRSGGTFARPEELSSVYISLLCFTWMFSSLFSFWGARATAFRILMVFGCAWGLFNVLSNLREPLGMVMQLLITTAPFFALAYASRRWPRLAGACLIVVALAFLGNDYWPGHATRMPLLVKLGVSVLFAGPLLASGIALAVGGGGDVKQAPAGA